MTPEQVVFQALSTDPGILALVPLARISPFKAVDEGMLPCITFTMIGARAEYTQDDVVNMQDPAVQIDLWVRIQEYGQLSALREAVLACLYGADSPGYRYFFVTNDGTDMLEPEARIARKMIEATLWYNREA
jgi:hypothetical protein